MAGNRRHCQHGTVDAAIDGKQAVTEYESVRRVCHPALGAISEVRLRPLTGRTHQLRRHLLSLGHPI
eukprot:4778668-Pyramimonas_sp.AAC.1